VVESANAKETEIAEADVPADLHESELIRRERGLASSYVERFATLRLEHLRVFRFMGRRTK
jgi:hypothetical protein